MAVTAFVFTGNLSAAVDFSGVVKIKMDDMKDGCSVELLEERNDGTYESSYVVGPQHSETFELYGSYKVQRSHDFISVGYVAA